METRKIGLLMVTVGVLIVLNGLCVDDARPFTVLLSAFYLGYMASRI